MNCIFCHERPNAERLTREHVFSRPIRRGFGIGDDTQIGRVNGIDGALTNFVRVDQFAVRLPCGVCNSGWMSALEVEAAKAIHRWQRSRNKVGTKDASTIMRWCLKTYIVLSAVEGRIRQVPEGDETPAWGVMPETTRARQLFQGDPVALDGVRVGASLVSSSNRLYGFGNPEIRSPHGGIAPNVSAGVSFVTLDNLRLWTVVALDVGAEIRLPPGVSSLGPHSRFCRLRSIGDQIDTSDAVVLNSQKLDAMAAALASVGRADEG
jgi:hypothetical protein